MSLIEKAADDGIFCTMLGTNDLLLTLQPDAARPIRKMEAYLHFLKQYLRSEQIIVIAPPLIGSDTIQDAFYQRCFRESRKMNDGFLLLAEKTGVIFVDASLWEIGVSFDHVHFSKAGHQKFASKIMELIRSNVTWHL